MNNIPPNSFSYHYYHGTEHPDQDTQNNDTAQGLQQQGAHAQFQEDASAVEALMMLGQASARGSSQNNQYNYYPTQGLQGGAGSAGRNEQYNYSAAPGAYTAQNLQHVQGTNIRSPHEWAVAQRMMLLPQTLAIRQAAAQRQESHSGIYSAQSHLGAAIHNNTVTQPRSASAINYSSEIDNTFLRSSRNNPDEICHRANNLQHHTIQYGSGPTMILKTDIYGNREAGDSIFLCMAEYNSSNDRYSITLCGRINCSSFNLSDACLTQLSRVMPTVNNFPSRLPQVITIGELINTQTKDVIDNIYDQHRADDNTAITIQRSRSNPESLENQQLYDLLATPIGKVIIHIIGDFNRVRNTNCTIEEGVIYKKPDCQLDFSLEP